VSEWGLDKAVLSLCAARICRMVLAEYVRDEVEENLLKRAGALSSSRSSYAVTIRHVAASRQHPPSALLR
jgi:hypothetical protein